uniref:Cathepsin putative n=1 Tax=Albugo laibachii Nc14 TaxID=890382 RepID=F0W4T1_9STRA|nr:cathepsin putative [Albugo laibachii Nc14]|eukprot:CCA16117.1 cathepsin putative [Albugo laibachii Nc14]
MSTTMTGSRRGETGAQLPLLQPNASLNRPTIKPHPSPKFSTMYIPRLQLLSTVFVSMVVGCLLSSIFISVNREPVVNFTNGNFLHRVRQEDDVLASCADAGLIRNKEKPIGKVHWFLGGPDPEVRVESLPTPRSIHDFPKNWDWRNYSGTGLSLTTTVMNQMLPRPCGSCWAFATVSSLSDRIRIAHYKKHGYAGPEIVLSPQVLLDCGMRSFGSCSGGDPRYAHKWIYENGIVDVTCNPYIASHPSWFAVGESCEATQCRTCTSDGVCRVLKNATKYYISEFGTLNATTPEEFELEAMNEIYHRGPIVASMYSHSEEYVNYRGGYILRDSKKYPGTTHVVSLVGWGTTEEGVKYWIVRNSDGMNWGESGFFYAERGTNIYNIESHGAWAVPIVQ